jgi:hypothetical protein
LRHSCQPVEAHTYYGNTSIPAFAHNTSALLVVAITIRLLQGRREQVQDVREAKASGSVARVRRDASGNGGARLPVAVTRQRIHDAFR